MPEKWTKETCVQKYKELKDCNNGVVPEYREFLRHFGIPKGQFSRLFGTDAYSKLQTEAGDKPNKLRLERTTLATIMEQYGKLAMEVNDLPRGADWEHRGLTPSVDGLSKPPHRLKWSQMPERFVEWVESVKVSGFDKAVEIIQTSDRRKASVREQDDPRFLRLIREIIQWTPARRRNSEETYKVELRGYLERLKYVVKEELGQSNFDLFVPDVSAIEIKKSPDLGDYDRLFGQIARHLQNHGRVIVVIHGAISGDAYNNFAKLVDQYFNAGETSVEIIKK
jgi:hypothetical protein